MMLKTRQYGGRVVIGNTPYGTFRVEWDASGELVSEHIEIRTPDQTPAAPKKRSDITPCSVLKRVIHKITGEKPCGQCNDHCKEMDERGWWWCWTHRRTIAGWLCESAKKRAGDLEQAARHAQQQASQAREVADAIDPQRAMTLIRAAWKELKR